MIATERHTDIETKRVREIERKRKGDIEIYKERWRQRDTQIERPIKINQQI